MFDKHKEDEVLMAKLFIIINCYTKIKIDNIFIYDIQY